MYTCKLMGDINGDGIVNMLDILIAGKAFGSAAEDDPATQWNETLKWNPDADLDSNGLVNIFDLVKIAVNFGKRCA